MPPPEAGGPDAGSLRPLAATLKIGALYDWSFALVLLAAPGLLERLFALPLPGEKFYLHAIAALLAIAGGVYWVAASDPVAYRPIVWIAVAGRALGAALLALPIVGRPDLAGLLGPALGDLAFAAAHLATGWRLLVR
jgi:hypothetical protein